MASGAEGTQEARTVGRDIQPDAEGKGTEKVNLGWIKAISDTYGPYAFGVISLIVVWLFLVQPELNRRGVDWESNQKIVEQHRENCVTLEKTSATLKDTAVVLDKTSERLERMVNK